MTRSSHAHPVRIRRRTVLASVGTAALLGTSGCTRRVRSILNRNGPEPVSLTIKTVPSDDDRRAAAIARVLEENLQAMGIDADVEWMDMEEFRRDVLVNREFDVYVARHPGCDDPDGLRPLLEFRFGEGSGWQNPFGFTDPGIDELLQAQVVAERNERRDVVEELLSEIARKQPFVTVCAPVDVRVGRVDRLAGWDDRESVTWLDVLAVEPPSDRETLRLVIDDDRPTENLNPISIEYRDRDVVTGVLYGPLAVVVDGTITPWLARSWSPTDDGLRVELREGLRWHDGEAVTAADVAFTYRFLADTSLGTEESAIPSPRFRGRSSLVEEVSVVDETSVDLSIEANDVLTTRALTVPLLPRHVWEERAAPADIVPGVPVPAGTTEALVAQNLEPVGNGPYRLVEREEREELVFERFDDHFLLDETDRPYDRLQPSTERLSIRVAPSSERAIELVDAGDVDATLTAIDPRALPAELPGSVGVVTDRSRSFYHVGFNVRRSPLANPYLRRILARSLDKAFLVETVFDGYGAPIATPITDEEWVPPRLRWRGDDPEVPFFGADGAFDEEAAREALTNIGYRFDDQGRLLGRA